MSTVFTRWSMIALLLAGCGHAADSPRHASPAPAAPDDTTVAGGGRVWRKVIIDGPYGAFPMAVPVIHIAAADPTAVKVVVDSVALREVERRLLSRMARVARAEAASLMRDTTPTRMSTRNPAPEIKRGLLGSIPFEPDDIEPSASASARIKAVAALVAQLPGRVEIAAVASGTSNAVVDAALARARRVYLDLVAADARLAEREVHISVRSIGMLPGAPLPQPVVEVYVSGQ